MKAEQHGYEFHLVDKITQDFAAAFGNVSPTKEQIIQFVNDQVTKDRKQYVKPKEFLYDMELSAHLIVQIGQFKNDNRNTNVIESNAFLNATAKIGLVLFLRR